jgi:hypothetical protein
LRAFFNWRGTIGKATGPDGQRMNVKGPIPDLEWIAWKDRKVIIAFDADAHSKDQVRIARAELAQDWRRRGAVVGFLEWDLAQGKESMIISRPSPSAISTNRSTSLSGGSLGPWWQIERVSSSRRTEVLLPHLHVAGRVEFEVGVVAPEPVFANARAARREVGDGDARVIPSSSAHELRPGEGIDAAQTRGFDNIPVQPTGFECRQIGGRQLLADDTSRDLPFFA